ncbi:hypothetical protein IFM89_017668 [Coptis chinensis]|uniref:Uncharacterized protein n=1 Tax=Coptis chinensis TaxID=261450 RepID=A0A835GX13_9MAGN|nr:hypothetical protein IFM89_017668 [Coptis chinensis]
MEMKKFEKVLSLRFKNDSANIIRCPLLDDQKYTSLRDILPHSPTFTTATNYEGNGFDSSNICIRNQLVKQAASAYLQSAILTNRNQHWMVRIWGKLHDLRSSWNIYVGYPLQACAGHILHFIAYILNPIGGVCIRD